VSLAPQHRHRLLELADQFGLSVAPSLRPDFPHFLPFPFFRLSLASDPIWDVLPTEPPGITVKEVTQRLADRPGGGKLTGPTIRARLKKGAGSRYQRDGSGEKNSPYCYWRGEANV
jgi:hypothetical protein